MARSLNALPGNTFVINTFFKKIGMADPSYMKMFMDEVAAFKGREVGKLQEVANNMDREVFAYDLQRCIDAGLWIANAIEAQGEEMDA